MLFMVHLIYTLISNKSYRTSGENPFDFGQLIPYDFQEQFALFPEMLFFCDPAPGIFTNSVFRNQIVSGIRRKYAFGHSGSGETLRTETTNNPV